MPIWLGPGHRSLLVWHPNTYLEAFNEQLELKSSTAPQQHVLQLLGDSNARLGTGCNAGDTEA